VSHHHLSISLWRNWRRRMLEKNKRKCLKSDERERGRKAEERE